MGLTHEQLKDILYSRGFLEDWVEKGPNVPAQVREHLKTLTDGYGRLREQVRKQEEQIAHQEALFQRQVALTIAQAELLKKTQDHLREVETLDYINDGKDEIRVIQDPEFIGWNLIGGIRYGKPVAITDTQGAPLVKVLVSPLAPDIIVEFDAFPLVVKRAKDGTVQKIAVDFTKGLGYE